MQRTRTTSLTAVLVIGFATAGAHAVLVGTPGLPGQSVGFPFGANPGGRYQQVYGSALFQEGDVAINSLSFFTSAPAPSGAALAPGPFTLSLSTTPRGVDELAAPFASNVGANAAVVFSGALPAVSGGRFTFDLAAPFTYQPSAGNLLLDVQSPASTAPGVFFDTDNSVPSSRLFSTGPSLTPDTRTLVTDIGASPITPPSVTTPPSGGVGPSAGGNAVPEPASMALLGAGLLGMAGLRRRVAG